MQAFAAKSKTTQQAASGGASHVSRSPAVGAILRPPIAVQAKLTVGAPDDPLEHEADRVADQVMRMAEPQVQRACDCGGCPKCAGKTSGAAQVQMKASATSDSGTAAPSIVHDVLNSPGQPLDAATRAFMEPRFGRDFGGVRVHDGALAAQSAAVIGAQAYAVGNDVVFGAGCYAPGTPAGRGVIAHELAHVAQQSDATGSAVRTIRRLSTTYCFPASAMLSDSASSKFGRDVEKPIEAHYCTTQGCSPQTELFDEITSSGAQFSAFIIERNPRHAYMAFVPPMSERPDILAHRPERKDFYEIKPDSPSGRQAGTDKIGALNTYFKIYELPYRPGIVYDPDIDWTLARVPYGVGSIEYRLRVTRILPGLIVYKVCVISDLSFEKLWELIGILLAMLLALFGLKALLETPVESMPGIELKQGIGAYGSVANKAKPSAPTPA